MYIDSIYTYIYISTYGRLILASGFLFKKKIDLPSKSKNELFQDRKSCDQ